MDNSLVSICIPTYNGSQFIAEAMDSAIAQSYKNLEIIISDDASTDNTLSIIESYRDKTKIPIQIFHHQPSGIGANWNNSIRKANGRYIKFLFQDDVLMPNCIEEMVKVLSLDKSFKMVTSKRDFIVEESFKNSDYKNWIDLYKDCQIGLELHELKGYRCLDNSIFEQNMFFRSPRNKIGEPTNVMFYKDIVNELGFYREDLKQILDYEFCYRFLKRYRIPVIEKKLVKFRLHQNQTTVKNKNSNIDDYVIYDRIIFNNYFKYLNYTHKKFYIKKFYPFAGKLFHIGIKIKRLLWK